MLEKIELEGEITGFSVKTKGEESTKHYGVALALSRSPDSLDKLNDLTGVHVLVTIQATQGVLPFGEE